jgi:GAF domain-containing protein
MTVVDDRAGHLERENAELRRRLTEREAELAEVHEQQTAAAEVLQVINSSPGDLGPVFDAITEKAMALCQAAYGGLWTYDGLSMHHAASRGFPSEAAEAFRRFVPPAGAMSHEIVQGAPVVHVADVSDSEAYRTGVSSVVTMVDTTGIKTGLWIALRKDDDLLGLIVLYRTEIRPFTDKQIALLQNFAAQAVIAIENARLLTETREALEQQTATAEVLQVINSSPGDLAPVFEAMLAKAVRLCDTAFGIMQTYNGERFETAALYGVPAQVAEWRERSPLMFSQGTAPARMVAGEDLVHEPDLTASEPYLRGDPNRRALVELGGARSHLIVALRKDGALLGIIAVYRQEARPFTDKQIALLQNFAAQAVIAMENARLLTETREALEQQTATAEVLQVINSSPGDLTPVFDAIREKAHTLCGAPHGALVIREGDYFRGVAMHGPLEQLAAMLRQPFPAYPGGPHERLLQGERMIHVPDQAASEQIHPLERASVEGGSRTLLFIPLRKDGSLLGYITAARQEVRPFAEKQIALLENFAAQAVIAIENARLLGELRQRTDEVAELNRGLEARVAEQVDELGRVGRLKRFLAPQLAELIVSQGDEKILESHRREIVVVFCDLRGYTAFTETAEPEEVLEFLREYHGALGPLVSQYEGTLDQFSGDGIMVFFNDPVPCPDPAARAVKMAMAMREASSTLIVDWRERGRDLGLALVSRKAMRRWARSGSPSALATPRSAPCAMSPPGCAPRPRTAKFCSVNVSMSPVGSTDWRCYRRKTPPSRGAAGLSNSLEEPTVHRSTPMGRLPGPFGQVVVRSMEERSMEEPDPAPWCTVSAPALRD